MKTFICLMKPWDTGLPEDSGLEIRIGLTIDWGDNVGRIRHQLQTIIDTQQKTRVEEAIYALGLLVMEAFEGRAFWIEIGAEDVWYQLYEHGT